MLGCGIDFLTILRLRGLEVRRRVWTARRRGLGEALRRPRLAALNARQPFLNPILAYFLGSPGLGTWKPSREPLLSNAQSSSAVFTVPTRAVLYRAGVIDMALAAFALQEVGSLAHCIKAAWSQLQNLVVSKHLSSSQKMRISLHSLHFRVWIAPPKQ